MILKVERVITGNPRKTYQIVRLTAVISQASPDGKDTHAVFEPSAFLENETLCKGFFLPKTNYGWLTPEMQTLLNGMETIDLPDSIKKLLPNTFEGCRFLKTVDLPKRIKIIPEECFKNCTALESLSIPDSISKIDQSAFENCSKLKKAHIPEGITFLPYNCFKDCKSLQAVNIPSTVKVLGACVFQNCVQLREISLPDGLEEIYYDCFSNCSALKEIKIPGGVRRLGEMDGVFAYCTNLSKVTLEEGIESINDKNFFNCQALEEINLPRSLVDLRKSAFENCVNLKKVNIPEGVASIPDSCFKNCHKLEEIKIPQSVESIGSNAFENCSKLKKITIPENLSSIYWYAFRGCSSLISISLPENITEIRSHTFQGCSSLTSIVIPDKVKEIQDNCFEGCSHLKEVQLPDNLTKICSNAFAKCHDLVNLRLPENVSEIEEKAFSECVSLEQIIIPKNLKAVGRDAFYNCSQLKSVTIPRWIEQNTSNFFTGSCHPTEISYHDNENILDKDGLLISIDRGAIISCLPGVASEITIPEEVKVISTNAFRTGRVRKIVILHPIVLEPGALSGVPHVQILDSVYTNDPNDIFLKLSPILKEIIDKNGVVLERFTREGGGVYYPENYDEKIFSRAAMTPWNHGNLLGVAIERLQNPVGLSEDARKKYEKYIAVRRKRAIDFLDWNDSLEELPLTPKVLITKYNIDDILERAGKKNKTQLVAYLLDYKKNVLKIDPFKEASAELTLDRTKTLRELQEDWIFTNLGQPELTIKGYRGEPQTTVVLPTCTNKKPITRLSDHCDGFRMDELIIPEGYTVIETRAMQNERSPRIVHMADSVIEIGYKAFCEAVKLEEIRLSDRLTRIEDRTFQGCVSLTKVNIPSSLRFIGKAAFLRCFSLELLVFSDKVVEIRPEAFFDCPKLVIHAPKDSYVFEYAKHYGIKLVEI